MKRLLNRRAALAGGLAALPALTGAALAGAASAMTPAHAEAELLALDAEIRRLNDVAKAIRAERVAPFDERYHAMAARDWKAACAYGVECGREAGVHEMNVHLERADRLWERMAAISATTQAGRAAKVRALLVHVMGDGWRGGEEADLDWHKEQARALFGEFAGMGAEELAAI